LLVIALIEQILQIAERGVRARMERDRFLDFDVLGNATVGNPASIFHRDESKKAQQLPCTTRLLHGARG